MSAEQRIRTCRDDETSRVLTIINEAAVAYRGIIPDDRWHDPYMTSDEFQRELEHGVSFIGMHIGESLVGVMGVQSVRDSDLIRHAYVLPSFQRHGVGGTLLRHLIASTSRRMLVGTWADATWAVSFYQRHGFTLADRTRSRQLLSDYWDVPARQAEVSVVLVRDIGANAAVAPPTTGQ